MIVVSRSEDKLSVVFPKNVALQVCFSMLQAICDSNTFTMRYEASSTDAPKCRKLNCAYEAGYELGNLYAILILQRPKLSPHKEAIRANLCKLLGADPSVVNLKAKTHEKVDSLGENRSITTHNVVLLMKNIE
ncbi:2-C-methyl-D-erythritol 2,4-cyclodiphosphate synthase, chloroplastic [Capsicum annuum]|nr:2-C-methyl-D-erythritol 2,4-cyclodiphosphate synthase, chloroplastic [Capsicum annuum]KAF3678691.1 2-C-methyl-D-erythritol 2,4-cyclodiphosphate synthase, chloroplastic [Capsicum annuum]